MTAQHWMRALLPASGRAFPRVAGVVLGLALARSDGAALSLVGVVVLVVSVMTNPTRWWRYVLTGATAESSVAAEFSEAGSCSVELRSPGARPIEVVKALREVTGAGLSDAMTTVDSAPAIIAERLSAASARRVRDRVELAGATAAVVTTDPGQAATSATAS